MKRETNAAADLKQAIEQLPKSRGRGRRYPRELKAAVVAYARPRVDAGASILEVAGKLDLSAQSVRRWLDEDSGSRGHGSMVSTAAELELVEVRHRERTGLGVDVVVYGPCGIVIDNVDLDTLVALLRRLS